MAFFPLVGGGGTCLVWRNLPPPDETSNDNIGDATLAAHNACDTDTCNTYNTRNTCITSTIIHTTLTFQFSGYEYFFQ